MFAAKRSLGLATMAALAGALADSSFPGLSRSGRQGRVFRRSNEAPDGYEMIDGILCRQSDKADRLPRGYPGAKLARKAARSQLTKRHLP